MKDSINMAGSYLIELFDSQTNQLIKRVRIKNQLTTINQTVRDQMLMGTYTGATNALQIQYFALGTGTTPASATDTQLANEVTRKQLTQLYLDSPGQVSSIVSFGSTEANFVIQEIGVFGGPDATSQANSGTLLARANVYIDKNSNIILNIQRSDICTI